MDQPKENPLKANAKKSNVILPFSFIELGMSNLSMVGENIGTQNHTISSCVAYMPTNCIESKTLKHQQFFQAPFIIFKNPFLPQIGR